MSAYKDKNNGTWYVFFYYRDWQGNNKGKTKRGFKTKKEALEWERTFLQKQNANLDMNFEKFIEIYCDDIKPRLKYNTWLTKEHIIKTKINPYFGKLKINEIKPSDIIKWQNILIKTCNEDKRNYSKAYLKTIQSQLSAIFNHAVRFYELTKNPVTLAGNMGKEKSKEMLFWPKDEYIKFSMAIVDKPQSYYGFEILYWCGLRVGELLALTSNDIDLKNKTITINKSYQRLHGDDYITEPKTLKSNRTIHISDSLRDELEEYLNMLYKYPPSNRIFPVTKNFFHHEMDRGCKKSGVKRIRIHDLRHSHISLLIDLGFTPVAIAERVGHGSDIIGLNW